MQSSNPLIRSDALRGAVLGVLLSFSALTYSAATPPPRPESQQEFWARYDKKDWSAAIDEARRLVESTRANAKQQPLALSNALTLLGNAQLSSGDKVNAEASYREALQLAEVNAGGASSALLDPLRGLGYSLAMLDRHQEAIPYLERSLVLSRRNYGLFEMSQQGVLRQLASSLTQTGRIADAQKHMLYLQRIGETAYGASDPRMSPLLCVIGDFYVDTGNFMLGRDEYRSALQIIERKLGKNDPALVDPLRSLARSYVQEIHFITQGYQQTPDKMSSDFQLSEPRGVNPKYISSDGEKALERALKILDSRPDTTPIVLTDTLIQFGDWYQVKHQPEKALPYYRRAATLVANMNSPTPEIAAALSFPVRIYYPLPPLAMRNRQLTPNQTDEKFVTVEFTVTGNGDVLDAKVTDQNGTSRQANEALQAIRASRFRPKFVNGEPVETQGVSNREVFKVRKQNEDDEKQS